MGVLIKIDGVTFTEPNIIGKVEIPVDPVYITDYPDRETDTTLKGLYALGGTVDATLTNHASEPHANLQDESLEGAYVMADSYVEFSGVANQCRMNTYLQTDTAKATTLIALFSVQPEQGAVYDYRPIISARLAGKNGYSLMSGHAYLGMGGTATAVPATDAINSNNFAILTMVTDEQGCRVYRYTNDSLVLLGEREGTVDGIETAKFVIGGNSTSNNYPAAKISLAAIHDSAVPVDKLEDICAFVKDYGKYKGLIIE